LKLPRWIFKTEKPEEVEGPIIRRVRTLTLKALSYKEALKLLIRDTFTVIFFVLLLLGLYRIYRIVFVKGTRPKEELKAYFKEDLKRVWEEGLKTFVAGVILVLARKGVIKFLEKASVVRVVFIVEFTFRLLHYGYRLARGELTWKDFWKNLFEDAVVIASGLAGTVYGATFGVFLSRYVKWVGVLALAFIFGFLGGIVGEFFARFVVKATEYLISKMVSHNRT